MTCIMMAAAVAVEAAITNGVAFLLANQADDGHWSDPQMPALTALPLWAIAGCAEVGGVRERLAGGDAMKRAAELGDDEARKLLINWSN